MDKIIFESAEHKTRYVSLLQRCGKNPNTELKATMYLLALIGENENALFNFDEMRINPAGISEAWQTGSTSRASRLLFVLWNGYPSEDDQSLNSIYSIFGYSGWDKYFIEAIKIRYPNTTAA